MRPSAHAAALGLVLAGGVLVIDPAGWSPFGPAKWLALTVLALVGLMLTVRRRRVEVARRALVVWGVFLAWVVLAAWRGVDPRLAWLGTPQRHFGALTWLLCGAMFVAGHALDDAGDARTVVGLATAVCGLAGGWSVAELAGWRPLALSGGDRLVGPLGSAAYLGAAMVLLVPIAVGVAADGSWRLRHRWAAAGSAGLGLVALVGSGARAAWLGAGVMLLALGWARRSRLRSRIGVTAAALVCGGGLLVGLGWATGVAGRVPATFQSGQPGGLSRVAEWQVATRVLSTHPLLGVGPEGYRVAFGSAVDASYQRRFGRDPLPDRAHDSLLDVAVTTGLPGVAGYLVLVGLVGALAWRALRYGPPWLAGVAGGLAAYTAGALFLFPIAELEPAVWLLFGLVAAQVTTEAERMMVRLPRLAEVAPAGVAALVMVTGVRAVAADRATRSALEASGRDSPTAVHLADRAVRLAPGDIVVRLAAAEIDAATGSLGGIDQGLSEMRAALGLSPRDPVLGEEAAHLLVQRAS